MVMKRYDVGYGGLQVLIRVMAYNQPLGSLLLEHLRLFGGRCTAYLPAGLTEQELIQLNRNGYSFNPSVDMNETFELCIVQLIKEYMDTTPHGIVLVEDVRGEENTDWFLSKKKPGIVGSFYLNDIAYHVLKHPFPGWNVTQDFVNDTEFVDVNSIILAPWPDLDKYLNGELAFSLDTLKFLAQKTDAMYGRAFDLISYVSWEKGMAGRSYSTELIQNLPAES